MKCKVVLAIVMLGALLGLSFEFVRAADVPNDVNRRLADALRDHKIAFVQVDFFLIDPEVNPLPPNSKDNKWLNYLYANGYLGQDTVRSTANGHNYLQYQPNANLSPFTYRTGWDYVKEIRWAEPQIQKILKTDSRKDGDVMVYRVAFSFQVRPLLKRLPTFSVPRAEAVISHDTWLDKWTVETAIDNSVSWKLDDWLSKNRDVWMQ